MKGIIIAGGFGTRLAPLTYYRPKHLLPVANRPFLEYQVALLKRHGIDEIIFATNYFAEMIEAHLGDGSRFGVTMHYALEEQPLGTAGAIRNAAALFPGEAVLVLNGDILTDFDLAGVIAFHRKQGAIATIALRAVERPHAFGVLDTDAEGRVRAWHEPTEEEKKRVAQYNGPPTGGSDYINAGIYVLEPEAIACIPVGRAVSIEREIYPALIAEDAPVFGIAPEGYWMDIGRPEQYLAANAAVLTRAVRTEVPFQQIGEEVEIAPDAEIDSTTSVGKGVRIGAGSRLAGCIILDGTMIGRNVTLSGVIADEDVQIQDDVSAPSGAVIAPSSVIGRGTRL
ncbi:MAG TPA: NDP-sugar synthase [Chthonomonadales bacterium]|nr:NDP-sugar synthase [Chthonomonadales bacterium]